MPAAHAFFAGTDAHNRAFLAAIYTLHLRSGTWPANMGYGEFLARCGMLGLDWLMDRLTPRNPGS